MKKYKVVLVQKKMKIKVKKMTKKDMLLKKPILILIFNILYLILYNLFTFFRYISISYQSQK